jgi:hypothetical protein
MKQQAGIAASVNSQNSSLFSLPSNGGNSRP